MLKNLTFPMVFLGAVTKIGKTSGKPYTVAKFLDKETTDVYDFFVREECLAVVKEQEEYSVVTVMLDIVSSKGDVKVNFVGIVKSA